MTKIVFFALACIAFTQVYGSEVDDAIKEALGKLDLLVDTQKIVIQRAKDQLDVVQSDLNSRPNVFIQKQTEFRNAAVSDVKNVSKELQQKAKDAKLPEEVTKCITQEEQSATLIILGLSIRYKSDVKRLQGEKLDIQAYIGRQISKAEERVNALHKQGTDDLKKCKTVESVRQTLSKIKAQAESDMNELVELNKRIHTNYRSFDMEIKRLTITANGGTTVNKTLGIKKMRDCIPKTA